MDWLKPAELKGSASQRLIHCWIGEQVPCSWSSKQAIKDISTLPSLPQQCIIVKLFSWVQLMRDHRHVCVRVPPALTHLNCEASADVSAWKSLAAMVFLKRKGLSSHLGPQNTGEGPAGHLMAGIPLVPLLSPTAPRVGI